MPEKMTPIQIKFHGLTALLDYSPGAYFLDVRGYPGQNGRGWEKVRTLSVEEVWARLLSVAPDVEGPSFHSAGIVGMTYSQVPPLKRDKAWPRGMAVVVESSETRVTAIYHTERGDAEEWVEIQITV